MAAADVVYIVTDFIVVVGVRYGCVWDQCFCCLAGVGHFPVSRHLCDSGRVCHDSFFIGAVFGDFPVVGGDEGFPGVHPDFSQGVFGHGQRLDEVLPEPVPEDGACFSLGGGFRGVFSGVFSAVLPGVFFGFPVVIIIKFGSHRSHT